MTVHTTYFAAIDHNKVEPADEDFVVGVVSRPADWTDDLVDRHIEALAPPESLEDAVENIVEAAEADDDVDDPTRVAWESTRYPERYRTYLLSAELSNVLGTLRERERDGDIWLVTYVKDPQWSHRRLLADELTRGREQVPEHHPDPSGTGDGHIVPNTSLGDFGGETA